MRGSCHVFCDNGRCDGYRCKPEPKMGSMRPWEQA
nr:MAG TPA: hypothetical protein [Caudoviricetes sp.]DAH85962.1 MAG TPA: hypothetical protein [Caudoviricetes sp.]